MALSMFLRTPVCTNQAFTKQVMRLATYSVTNNSSLTMRGHPSVLQLKDKVIKAETSPIFNSVRSFRTSAVRMSDEKPHDHAKLWVIEKATSALLVPLIPLGLLMPNKIFDSLLAILITAHSFWVNMITIKEKKDTFAEFDWGNTPFPIIETLLCSGLKAMLLGGLEAIAVDYVRASIFGPVIPKIAIGLVYLISIATLGGLFYVISHDVGIANTIRQLWAVNSQKQAA